MRWRICRKRLGVKWLSVSWRTKYRRAERDGPPAWNNRCCRLVSDQLRMAKGRTSRRSSGRRRRPRVGPNDRRSSASSPWRYDARQNAPPQRHETTCAEGLRPWQIGRAEARAKQGLRPADALKGAHDVQRERWGEHALRVAELSNCDHEGLAAGRADRRRQPPGAAFSAWHVAARRISGEPRNSPPSVHEIREQIGGDLWNRPEPITHAPRDSASATEQVGLFRVTADAMAHRPLQEDLARKQLNCHATWTSRCVEVVPLLPRTC